MQQVNLVISGSCDKHGFYLTLLGQKETINFRYVNSILDVKFAGCQLYFHLHYVTFTNKINFVLRLKSELNQIAQ